MIKALFGLPRGRGRFAAQHGPTADHLPSARENVQLLSKLELRHMPWRSRKSPERHASRF